MKAKILIIEDERLIRNALQQLLERNNFECEALESLEEALALKHLNEFNLIISDVRLPGAKGTDILKKVKNIPIIIMTSFADVESAVDAMKLGAVDYISKPFNHDEMLIVVNKALTVQQQQNFAHALETDLNKIFPVDNMIGESNLMKKIFTQIDRVAKTNTTVIILAESGTGKELVARAIHAKSDRNKAPFICFNCASISDEMMEQELFGTNEKSGLVKQAQKGTLFLDEVGELPLAIQGRLLRLLQQEENNDIRFIASSNKNLKQMVQNGEFRDDLYYRLMVFQINPPPLREREDDIALITIYLLNKICQQIKIEPLKISKDTFNAIRKYSWPGNIRELSNALERAALMCESDTISPDLLAIDYDLERGNYKDQTKLDMSLEAYFKSYLLEYQENKTETELAKQLGISRKTLWERRQKFGIPRK